MNATTILQIKVVARCLPLSSKRLRFSSIFLSKTLKKLSLPESAHSGTAKKSSHHVDQFIITANIYISSLLAIKIAGGLDELSSI